ncbi:MAG: hypothetical protein JNK64_41435 [Myxococcales bacterium]|nr:hypothetical protein [Myxococcales bacterium]
MADPASLLTRLEPGVELAAGKVRGLGPAVAALVEAGWLEARKDGRAVMVRLTAAGEAERARQAAAPPPPKAPKARAAAAGKPPTPAARLAALEATVAALAARLAALEAAAPHASPAPAPPPAAAPADPIALRSTIVAVIGELDAGGRLGGLVPIPDVRTELRRRGVGASDAEVTTALEELERSWAIDLSAAQSPTAVRDRAAGIDRAGRGLLYYVARR